MKFINKATKYLFYLIAALAITVLLVFFYLRNYSASPVKQFIYQNFSYPAALVGQKPILVKGYIIKQKIGLQFSQTTKTSSGNLVLDSMILDSKIAVLVKKYQLGINQLEARAIQTQLEQNKEFSIVLQKYGLAEKDFNELFVYPLLRENSLRIWLNANQEINKKAYATASLIHSRLNKGEDFSQLAKEYSADSYSKKLEGDLGFVEIDALLPEVQEALKTADKQQVLLVASRKGLHLIKIEEIDSKNPNKYHLRQILINTVNFESWLNEETKNINIINIVNLK